MIDAASIGFARPWQAAATLAVFALLSAVVAGATAIAYRWYFGDRIPEGVTVLLGMSVVAIYLNTTSLGLVAVGGSPGLLKPETAFFNLVALAVTAVTAPAGRYVGDRIVVDVFALSSARRLDGELSGIVRAAGRFTSVVLPPAEAIADMGAYDPVSPERKAEIAESTLLFAGRLPSEELRSRLVARVKQEYGVGHVDIDLAADGTVEYFAVGSRVAGLGPTLSPGSAAVAIAADPPKDATPGDTVQVWRTDPEPRRVATGELRGVAGDVVTVALDESDAESLTAEAGYRLVTLPSEPQADREFASLLRRVDETMATVTVADGSSLVGTTVGEVGTVVAAVRPEGGSVQPIPRRSYAFGAGDSVYLVGRPDVLRRVEGDAAAPAGANAETGTTTPDAENGEGTGGAASADAGDRDGEGSGESVGSAGETAGTDSTDDRTQRS